MRLPILHQLCKSSHLVFPPLPLKLPSFLSLTIHFLAGSGKTRTLTARVAFLLASHGFSPSNVIVATFTVKAAREMKERIGKLIGNGLERKLILGTFHSIARRYLVRYGHLIGLRKAFGIADSNDSLAIIKRILKRRKADIDPASARSRISHIKAQGLSCGEYVAKNKNSAKRDVAMQEFGLLYKEYEEALAQANLLDYDDLLLRYFHPSLL